MGTREALRRIATAGEQAIRRAGDLGDLIIQVPPGVERQHALRGQLLSR